MASSIITKSTAHLKEVLEKMTIGPSLKIEEREELLDVLRRNQDCFASSSTFGQTIMTEHCIQTCDVTPIHSAPYRVSPIVNGIFQEQVKDMPEKGIISPFISQWAAPAVMVKEKVQNNLRFCVDYKRLNGVIRKDVYHLPRINDALDRLGEKIKTKIFYCKDMKRTAIGQFVFAKRTGRRPYSQPELDFFILHHAFWVSQCAFHFPETN